jgi:hypothetical protein
MDIEKAMKNIEGVLNKSNEGGSKVSVIKNSQIRTKADPNHSKTKSYRDQLAKEGKKLGIQSSNSNCKKTEAKRSLLLTFVSVSLSNCIVETGKDLKDIKSQEWYQMYGDISNKLESQLDENKKI